MLSSTTLAADNSAVEFSEDYLRAKQILRKKWLAKASINLDEDVDPQKGKTAFNTQLEQVKKGESPINHLFNKYYSELSTPDSIKKCTDVTQLTTLKDEDIEKFLQNINKDKENIKLIIAHAEVEKKKYPVKTQ